MAQFTSSADSIDPTRILRNLQLIPIGLISWLEGKSLRPYLAEALCLSPSRLRSGKSMELRASTEQRAIANSRQRFEQRAAANGWTADEIAARLAETPSVLAGKPRPYADLIYGLEYPGCWRLPLTIAFAEEIDSVLSKLIAAHEHDDLEAFKHVMLECDWGDGVQQPESDRQETARREDTLRSADNWSATLKAACGFFENLLFCLLSALDAEFGSIYFDRFQPRPLFLLVAPKMHPNFDPNALDKLPSRNLVGRPVRRLLELSHAMMMFAKEKRWSNKPVGRKKLGEALDLDDQSIGNLFDGTRKMSVALFDKQWIRLSKNVAQREPCAPPLPLLCAAIFWQNAFITKYPNQKLKSIVIPDDATYTRFWLWHRMRWASLLGEGAESWPDWLSDQSLLSTGT